MGNKANWEGVAISDENVVTAEGGFVGNLTGAIIHSVSNFDNEAIDFSASLALVQRGCTLPDSSTNGREIIIAKQLDTGVASVTLSTTLQNGNNTLTFSDDNDSITLIWTNLSGVGADEDMWIVKSNNGVVLSTV